LRAKHSGCAVRAAERVVHIDRDAPADLAGARVQAGQIDGRNLGQARAAGRDRFAGGVEKARAEPGEQTGSAVGAGGAADTEQTLVDLLIE
jgi:hypothetical protein